MSIKYNSVVKKEDFFKVYTSVMNGILNLTPSERQCLVELLKKDRKSRFKRGKRTQFSGQLKKSEFNVNNLISRLKKKGIIKEGEDGLELNPKILDILPKDGVEIVFSLSVDGSRLQ